MLLENEAHDGSPMLRKKVAKTKKMYWPMTIPTGVGNKQVYIRGTVAKFGLGKDRSRQDNLNCAMNEDCVYASNLENYSLAKEHGEMCAVSDLYFYDPTIYEQGAEKRVVPESQYRKESVRRIEDPIKNNEVSIINNPKTDSKAPKIKKDKRKSDTSVKVEDEDNDNDDDENIPPVAIKSHTLKKMTPMKPSDSARKTAPTDKYVGKTTRASAKKAAAAFTNDADDDNDDFNNSFTLG